MKLIANELESFIEQHTASILQIQEEKFLHKLTSAKWSKKEIIGHLIDSAHSNIRRFVIAQYEDNPTIVYNQEKWVAISNYQHWNSNQLINLWYLLNKQVVEILKNTSADMSGRTCFTNELQTVHWLAADYIKHLRHHIHQVLDLSPCAYP